MLILKRSSLVLTIIALAGGIAIADPPAPVAPEEEISLVPPLPATPAAVQRLIHAQPFVLEQGYEFEWRADRPVIKSGWLLVLQVDSALVFPRQVAEPVLYVGKTTAERINIGHQSGRVVAIVPSALGKDNEPELKLAESLMWFGNPGLPEQVDEGQVESSRVAATRHGIKPFDSESIALAREARALIQAENREALRNVAADLIATYSPQEAELIESIRAEAAAALPK
jgi:hypothetical protein